MKKIQIIGATTYFILGVLAMIFYMERAAFLDISFHLFYILKDSDFAIQNNRFVAFITQSFPLIASKMLLGLKTIMKLYSLSFILLYAGVFFVLLNVFKAKKYAISMLLFSVLITTHTFYWIQSELPQGLAIMILYFGFLDYLIKKKRYVISEWKFLPLQIILLFIIAFAHPLIIFPFVYLSLFFAYINKEHKKIYLSSLISFLAIYFIKAVLFRTDYDSASMKGILNIIYLFPDYFSIKSNKDFLHYVINDYYFLIAGLITLVVYFIIRKEYIKLILVIVFFTGYLFMINVSYPDGTAQFYIENLYLPLSIIVIFPLVFEFYNKINTNYFYGILILIILIRITDIYYTHIPYTKRIAFLEKLIEETNNKEDKKLIIDEKSMPDDILIMSWATPYEIWLLSTIKTGTTSSIIITDNTKELEWTLPYNNRFVTKWGAFSYDELPRKYFIFKDNSKYKIIGRK